MKHVETLLFSAAALLLSLGALADEPASFKALGRQPQPTSCRLDMKNKEIDLTAVGFKNLSHTIEYGTPKAGSVNCSKINVEGKDFFIFQYETEATTQDTGRHYKTEKYDITLLSLKKDVLHPARSQTVEEVVVGAKDQDKKPKVDFSVVWGIDTKTEVPMVRFVRKSDGKVLTTENTRLQDLDGVLHFVTQFDEE